MKRIAELAREIAKVSDTPPIRDKNWQDEAIEWLAWAIEALALDDEKECKACIRIALKEMKRKVWELSDRYFYIADDPKFS